MRGYFVTPLITQEQVGSLACTGSVDAGTSLSCNNTGSKTIKSRQITREQQQVINSTDLNT